MYDTDKIVVCISQLMPPSDSSPLLGWFSDLTHIFLILGGEKDGWQSVKDF